MNRQTREDQEGVSVHTQESHTGTPKGVPENVTWRSRPVQTVSVRGVEAESDEETELEIGEVYEFPMDYNNPRETDFPMEITPLPEIGWVVWGASRTKNDEVTSREGPKTNKSADEGCLGARLVDVAEQTRKKKMAKLLELRGGMAVDVVAPMFPPNPQRAPSEGNEVSSSAVIHKEGRKESRNFEEEEMGLLHRPGDRRGGQEMSIEPPLQIEDKRDGIEPFSGQVAFLYPRVRRKKKTDQLRKVGVVATVAKVG